MERKKATVSSHPSHTPGYYAWQRFKSNKTAFAGLIVIIFLCLLALPGYLIVPDATPNANRQMLEIQSEPPGFRIKILKINKGVHLSTTWPHTWLYGKSENETDIPIDSVHFTQDSVIAYRFTGGRESYSLSQMDTVIRRTYWLGTDRFGRDMLSRLILGARVSLSIGIVSVAISLLLGIVLGSLAGFFGGWVDVFIQWLINVVWSIPSFLLVMAIALVLGRGFWQVFLAIGLTLWVEVARIIRGQILGARELEFAQAARALGYKNGRIIFRHILPNILGPVMVIAAANFSTAILLEAGLSFLGLGVQPPTPSWGVMINDSYAYLMLGAPWMALLPGIAIMILVLSFNMLGNGLRDALDVRG